MSDKTFIDVLYGMVDESDGILMGVVATIAVLVIPVLLIIASAARVPETEMARCKMVNENDKVYLEVSEPCKLLMQELVK